jgi:neurexin
MEPITFSSPNSYIPIHNWKDYPKLNSFSIEFQTTENFGVLAYILGAENSRQLNANTKIGAAKIRKFYNQNSPSSGYAHHSSLLVHNRDFFSLEIHNRFLNAYFNLGTSYIRHEIVHEHVSSGKSHQISVEINNKYAIFRFDQRPETSIVINPNESESLDLMGPLIIGGIYPNHTAPPASSPSLRMPPYFYSGMLANGYVGCIQDVEINGQFVNLTHYASLEAVSGVNTEMCTPMPNQCDIGHCMNDGVCMEGWNRFVCDCSATGYNGPICNQRKLIFIFLFS